MMTKKTIRIVLTLVIGFSMVFGNHILASADTLDFETSTKSIPKTYKDSNDGKFSVTETSKWLNTDLTEGEVTVNLKSVLETNDKVVRNQDIIFISDISGSMTGTRIDQMKLALKQSAADLLKTDLNNKVALASFDDRVSTDYELGQDLSTFNNAVENMFRLGKGGGGTSYEAGLKQAYDIINGRTEKERNPIVIFMTDGSPTSLSGIDLYQKQIKNLGATIYTVQYMNGSSIAPILTQIATSESHAYNASKASYLTDIYNGIIKKIISSKSYENVQVKFDVRDVNFDLKEVKAEVGTVTKSGHTVTWTIPSLLSGSSVNLTTKVDVDSPLASGYLLAHKEGKVTYNANGVIGNELLLESTTLDRITYNVIFDKNGATSGEAPDNFVAAGTSMIEVPANPKGLGKTNHVFLGWSRADDTTKELATGKIQMPSNDLVLKAVWGSPTISMNTDTVNNPTTRLVTSTEFTKRLVSAKSCKAIKFVDYVDPGATILLSESGDEPIKAWLASDTLFIGSAARIMAPSDCSSLFSSFTVATSIEFNNLFDTSNVENMAKMFYDIWYISSLDVSSFNTSKVKNMSSMFANIGYLTTINVSGFDTSNVTDMSNMFDNDNLLTTINVSNFNTANVTNMKRMFYGCKKIKELDLTTFDFGVIDSSKVSEMFADMERTTEIWVESEEVVNGLKNSGAGEVSIKVKPVTTAIKTNEEITTKSKTRAEAPIIEADGLVNGGKINLANDVDYKITVGFSANAKSASGVMKVTNVMPSGMTYNGGIVKGAPTWDDPSNAALASGEIYGETAVGNVLTFYVKNLSAGSKIELTYKATPPTTITEDYKEFWNQSSVSVEDVNIVSNFVRHYAGDKALAPVKYKFAYSYVDAPVDAPMLPTEQKYAQGHNVGISTMSMPGYIFNGWVYNGTLVTGNTMTMPNSDVELVGSWTKLKPADELKATVTYKYEGDIPTDAYLPKEQIYTVGSVLDGNKVIVEKTITIADNPIVEGYEFTGWTSEQLNTSELTNGSFQLGENSVILVGKWKKKEYKVAYKYLDPTSTPIGAQSLPIDAMVEWGKTVNTANKLSNVNGYVFDGWYSDSNIDTDFQERFIMPQENVTLYAYWTEKPYTITYEYVGDMPSDAIALGTSVGIAGQEITTWLDPTSKVTTDSTGTIGTWQFNGWTSEGVVINNKQFTMPTRDVILKGSWTFVKNENIRFVDFKVENGTWQNGTKEDQRVIVELDSATHTATLLEEDIPTNMIANPGYTDGQWVVKPNTDPDGVVGNVTYTYKFIKKPVITFEIENGTWDDGTTIKTVDIDMINGMGTLQQSNVPTNMLVNNGYGYGRWIETPNTNENAITGDITYIYRYVKQSVVTFKVENGTWADGTTEDKVVALEMVLGKATLPVSKVPTGMLANSGYQEGYWLLIPNTNENGITKDITYTYRYNESLGDITITDEEKSKTPDTSDTTKVTEVLIPLVISGVMLFYCLRKRKYLGNR